MIIFYIYVIGFGAIAICTLQTAECKKSSMPLLSAIMGGVLWPILLPIGFCIGFRKAYKKQKEKKNSS